jgi:hypothetical protein
MILSQFPLDARQPSLFGVSMKVSEFVQLHPDTEIDFAILIRDQKRTYDPLILDQYPIVLEPDFEYRPGGRGRPNLNQTLTHSQCASCHRVLRNDMFYTLPSMAKRNLVFSHCRECNQDRNAARYELRADLIRARRMVIWQYLAPRCAICGFDKHISAMDMHHQEQKEGQIAELITHVTFTLSFAKIEALFREAAKCIPLCSNCHRMLHANVVTIPLDFKHRVFRIAELLGQLQALN